MHAPYPPHPSEALAVGDGPHTHAVAPHAVAPHAVDLGAPLDDGVEERRQRAVESLGIQVDRPEERFDRIVRLAHHVFSVPMATITVIDGDRALFPGVYGAAVRSLPRDQTLCAMTLNGSPQVIPDLADRPDLREHAAVEAFGIRFYAGHPLRDPFGNVVGTLAVYDVVPRSLGPDLLLALDDMAAWAQQELVASAEMTQATRVQASMLPSEPLVCEEWTIAGICLPSLAVGGDFYDYRVSNGVAHVDLGDVMGKGTAAALVCAGVRSALRGTHPAITSGVDLGITSTQVARTLYPDLSQSESFVTLFSAAIDLEDGWLRYVDAGSGLCLLVRADGTVEHLRGADAPFGILPDDYWTEHQDSVEPGDRMLVFSDGLLDLLDDPQHWWREVGELVSAHADHRALLQAISGLSRERAVLDDVTAVAVYRSPRSDPA